MSRSQWEPTFEDVVRLRLYMLDRWLYDCPVCSHAIHDGPCTRKVYSEFKGILRED